MRNSRVGLDRTEIDVFWIPSRHGGGNRLACRFRTVSRLRREAWRCDTRGWLTVGYDEGRKALPVNGNHSLGVTPSPPLGSGHHHVGIMASTDRTDEAL